VEFGWPVGMPVCRPLGHGIYEVRTSLAQNRISRVLFYIDKKGQMVLLHGFIKKRSSFAWQMRRPSERSTRQADSRKKGRH